MPPSMGVRSTFLFVRLRKSSQDTSDRVDEKIDDGGRAPTPWSPSR